MQKSRFPDSLVLILCVIVFAQLLTYVLPAGVFERDGRAVIPGTYHQLEADPSASGFVAFLKTLPMFLPMLMAMVMTTASTTSNPSIIAGAGNRFSPMLRT